MVSATRLHATACARGLWLALALWLLATAAQAGQVSVHAYLDRDHVKLGDTVTLNVEVDGATLVAPPVVNLSASDFDVLGTSQSTSVGIVDGRRSVKVLWAIGMRPQHAGTITIPPLTIDGQTTTPLTLVVDAAPVSTHGGPGDPVFIRVKPSTRTPYVGQQVDLVVRLFYAPNIASGSLEAPHGHGASVRQLGSDTRYESERDGRVYKVLEKHYAVIAQHAGSLQLPPVTFTGAEASADRFAIFFGNGKTVTARSAPIELKVRARPAAASSGAWLPARQLTLQLEGLPADGHVQAGQPLTLTLTETAIGLPFESLPEPRLPTLAGVDVYPARTHDHTGTQGAWLQGTRTRKFALVPQHAGTLTIPAITLAWWNVRTDRREVARIPAHTLHVAAASGAGAQGPVPAASVPSPAPAPATHPHAGAAAAPAAATPARPGLVHAWIAWGLGLVALALALALGWVWWRRRRHQATSGSGTMPPIGGAVAAHRLRQAFLEAARHGDLAARCDALLAWARCERPGLRSLGELATALDSQAQCAIVSALQRARYAGQGAAMDPDAMVAAFRHGLAWRKATPNDATDAALPPLYP